VTLLPTVIVTFACEDIRRRRVSKLKAFHNETSLWAVPMI